MIEIRGLTVLYPNRSITFPAVIDIPPRGNFLISGDNGCGKSSLVRAVIFLHRRFDGTVGIDGADNRSMKRLDIARKVSYLPQTGGVQIELPARDFILQGLYALGSAPDTEARYRDISEGLGITGLSERNFAELSGGEKQLCRIARALIAPVSYSFLDEADAFLSRKNRARFYEYIGKISAGRAVILVTHSPSDAPGGFETLLEMYD
ncbi:MAG: ABC transporter ATP-binding protein [Brevinematales bacterium]|nr:ABC transporter ATP-binding protein [Brevinematales bacterium]